MGTTTLQCLVLLSWVGCAVSFVFGFFIGWRVGWWRCKAAHLDWRHQVVMSAEDKAKEDRG